MIQHEIGDSGSATWDPLRRPNRIHLNEESLLSRPGGSVQVFREGDYTLHAEMKGAMTQRVNRVLIEADAGDAGSKVAPLADISGVDERGNRIKLTGGYLRDSNSTHVTAPAVGEYSVGADFQCIEKESAFGVFHSEAARWRCVVWTLNCPIRRGDLGRVRCTALKARLEGIHGVGGTEGTEPSEGSTTEASDWILLEGVGPDGQDLVLCSARKHEGLNENHKPCTMEFKVGGHESRPIGYATFHSRPATKEESVD